MRKQKKYLHVAVLFNPIFLLVIWNGLRVLSLLCQYGGVKRRVPVLLLTGVISLVWLIIWSIWGIKKKRREDCVRTKRGRYSGILLVVELLVLIGMLVFYGVRIYESAIDLNGKLAWYLHDKSHSKTMELTQNDFFEDGVSGILTDIEKKIDLPEELYVENVFQIEMQGDGTITELYAFLYGEDKKGETQTFLLDYDSSKDDKMTVWLGDSNISTYEERQKLQPMIDLTKTFAEDSSLVDTLKQEGEGSEFFVTYRGYTEVQASSTIYTIDSNGMLQSSEPEYDGAEVEGYLLEWLCDDEQYMVMKSDSNNADVVGEDTQGDLSEFDAEESQDEQSDVGGDEYPVGESYTDENGDMHYYLSETKEMILHVTGAALGSRAYAFKCDSIENEIPFGENIGVAEGMYFKDEYIGFAALGNASMDYSVLYGTADGGQTFTLITLPVEMGEADLEGNTYGFTTQDFDFYGVPFEKNGAIYVKVGTDSAEVDSNYMLFQSDDLGATWSYVQYVNQFLQD